MSSNHWDRKARLELADQNVFVEADSNIVSWLQQGLMDPNFDSPVGRGRIKIGLLSGEGPITYYPHATEAVKFLRQLTKCPPVSVFYRDGNRLIWRHGVHTVWIDLTKPLTNYQFVDMQLKRILGSVGGTDQQIDTVFNRVSREDSREVAEGIPEKLRRGSEGQKPSCWVHPLSEILDARYAKPFEDANIRTVADVMIFIQEHGPKKLYELEGVGKKTLEELEKSLKILGVGVQQGVAEGKDL